jgi:RNA polymerase sigma-70 factor (ECF subfamily)
MGSIMISARTVHTMGGDGPDKVAIMRRVAEGDQAAMGDLYDATSRIILGMIQKIVSDPMTAEEITLDVYAQAWRLAPTYSQEKGTPVTWLLMLARSRAIDHLRSRARRVREMERPIQAALGYSHPDPNPEMAVISGNRGRLINKLLAVLAPEQLEVLRLAFFDGLTHSEIAEKTGIPLGTIKSRIRTGMMRMRELLEPQAGALW